MDTLRVLVHRGYDTDTAFRPGLDHLAADGAWVASGASAVFPDEACAEAARASVDALRGPYGQVLDAYRVPERIAASVGAARPEAILRDRAAAIAAVDYFLARIRPPRRSSPGEVVSGSRRRELRAFLQGRLSAWAETELARTTALQAVLRWVPDPWIPVEPLRRAIARGAGISDRYRDVAVSLELQPSGGACWVRERTLEEWPTLRASLDAGRPLPVDLIVATQGEGAGEAVTVVVYGYEEKGSALSLHVYQPSAGPVGRWLRFDLAARELRGLLASPVGRADVVRGFRCHAHVPREPPAFGAWWLLRLLGLHRIAWRFTRWLAPRPPSRRLADAEAHHRQGHRRRERPGVPAGSLGPGRVAGADGVAPGPRLTGRRASPSR